MLKSTKQSAQSFKENKETITIALADLFRTIEMCLVRKYPLIVLVVFFMLFFNVRKVNGQKKRVSSTIQQWIQYYSAFNLDKKWSLLADGGLRWRDGFEERSQYIIRAGVGYSLKPEVRIATGIANLGFYSDGEQNTIEIRPYQKVSVKRNFGTISLSHRYRIEERFFNAINDGGETPNWFNVRFRYSVTLGIPLFKLSQDNEDIAVLLNVGNEVFLNAGNDIVHNIFDQNRLIVSPSLKMNRKLTFSFTWNYQFASSSRPAEFTTTHVAWLQIKHQLN